MRDPFPYPGAVYFICGQCQALTTMRGAGEFMSCKRCKSLDIRMNILTESDIVEMNEVAARYRKMIGY